MQYSRFLGVSAAALILSLSAAQAADLADVQDPVFAPAMPLYSFSGVYVGANAGYVNGSLDADLFDPTTGANLLGFGGDGNGGITGGIQAGVNAQFDRFVLGVEADISAISFDLGDDDTLLDTALAPAFPLGTAGTLDVDVDYLATLRGRAGVAVDRFMVYGTAGLAFTSVDVDYSIPGATFDTNGSDDIQVGYAVGGGIEGLVSENLTAKLEYLYVDFEDETLDFTVPVGTGVTRSVEADLDMHVVRAGVNYKFNGF